MGLIYLALGFVIGMAVDRLLHDNDAPPPSRLAY